MTAANATATPRRRRAAVVAVVAALVAGLGAACSSTPPGRNGAPAAGDDPATGTRVQAEAPAGPVTDARRAAPPAAGGDPGGPPWLIKHGWDIPQPEFVERNVATMEQRGFDGVVIQIPSSGDVLSLTPVSYEQLRAELEPLARTRFTTMDRNFVIVYSGDLGGYEGDWSTAVTNVGHLARAAREVGLQGIVYDNENYEGVTWDWKAEEAGTSLRRAEELVMAKGHDVMAAIGSQWPDATVISLIGPWLSHPSSADHFDDRFGYNDLAWANELIGPFFLGMATAAGDSALTLVDGGEVYTPRSREDFDHAYEWLKEGVVADDELLSAAVRSRYAETVSVGFGVFDRPLPDAPMDAERWRTTLTNALRTADHYVWAYTEIHNWWGTGWPDQPVPEEYVRATTAIRSELGR